MIKGANEFHLNEATVIAALEEYLNARIVKGDDELKVTDVSMSLSSGVRTFIVKIQPKEDA